MPGRPRAFTVVLAFLSRHLVEKQVLRFKEWTPRLRRGAPVAEASEKGAARARAGAGPGPGRRVGSPELTALPQSGAPEPNTTDVRAFCRLRGVDFIPDDRGGDSHGHS